MSEILDPEKIAALVEAAQRGELPEPAAGATTRRGSRLRTVDFARPTKFNSEQQRLIVRAIETFCQTAVTRLSSELRVPVELEVLNTLQLTWSAAQHQLPPSALSVLVDVSPIETRMLLTVEKGFVFTCLECVLGGSAARPPRERRMSEIDWHLTRRLFDNIVAQLSVVWQELGPVSLSVGEVDVHDASSVASVSEPTLTVLIECRMAKQSFALALLVPWLSVDPLLGHSGADEDAQDPAAAGPIAQVMAGVPVTLRAEVADTELAVAEILALEPGSVVRFRTRCEEGITVFAENVKLAGAHPGANGARRAIQIRRTAASAV